MREMCRFHLTAGIMSYTALYITPCVKGGTHPHFTHRFAKFGTIPLQMNPKNVHFQSSKDQEWRSLPCVSKTLQRRSFCKTMLPNRTTCKTMLPIESAEGTRSQRKRPFYALCDTIYCKPMVPVLQTYG